MSSRYDLRGVSSKKTELHRILNKSDSSSSFHKKTLGAFCQGIDFPSDISFRGERPIFFHHADGAGSKPILAYLWWKESGRLDGFKSVAHDALVMNTDDLLSVGIVDGFSFSSIISRNKKRIPQEVLQTLIEANQSFVEKINSWGISAKMAGGETADVGDTVSTLLVDATACAFALPDEIIHPDRIKPNDLIIGFSSFGKTIYEDQYNSGVGCNGITSLRHDILSNFYREHYPETLDEQTLKDYTYVGEYKLSDTLFEEKDDKGNPLSIKIHQALLSPTRTYLPLAIRLKKEGLFSKISAIFHNTGGGLTKCLRFGKSIHYVKDNLFPFPPIFQALLKQSKKEEMYGIFNCGHRLEMVVRSEKIADEIIALSKELGIEAKIIGHCQSSKNANKLTIKDERINKTFTLDE